MYSALITSSCLIPSPTLDQDPIDYGNLIGWTQAEDCLEYVVHMSNASKHFVNLLTMTYVYNMTAYSQHNVLHRCRHP